MKIYSQSKINLQLFETNGTDYRKLSTRRDCYFPKNCWKTITLSPLKNQKKELKNPFILFFSITDQIRLSFLNNILPSLKKTTSSEDIFSLAAKALATNSFITLKEFRSVDISITPSHQKSTAFNYQIEEYLGLHIDTHDGISNSQRSDAWSLIAINLGTAKRYLNFIDMSFDDICNKLRNEKNIVLNWEEIKMPELVSLFFLQFPNHPIRRVEIPPSHGYIACTQNFIHDGATNTIGDEDINMLISGNFKIINKNIIEYIF